MEVIVAWSATGTILIVNIVGWLIMSRRNGKRDAYYHGIMNAEIKNLVAKVGDLLCVADPTYLESKGAIKQHMKDVDARLVKLELKNTQSK